MRAAVVLSAACLVVAVSACDPFSKRPRLEPLPLAPVAELKGKRPDVSEKTIARLREDGLPLAHVTVKDAYAESPWLDSASMQPTTRRPLGTDVIKVRTWVDPSKPGYSRITIEPVYRVSADPSVPERELDRLVPEGHPARKWAEAFFEKMGAKPVEVIPVGPTTKRSGAMPTSGQGGILRMPSSGRNDQ